jgi:hypothetical protein
LPTLIISQRSSWPTHEAPQLCAGAERKRTSPVCEGREAAEILRFVQDFACGLRRPHDGSSSNLPVPTNSVLPTPIIPQRSSWPTHEAPQLCGGAETHESSLRGARGG